MRCVGIRRACRPRCLSIDVENVGHRASRVVGKIGQTGCTGPAHPDRSRYGGLQRQTFREKVTTDVQKPFSDRDTTRAGTGGARIRGSLPVLRSRRRRNRSLRGERPRIQSRLRREIQIISGVPACTHRSTGVVGYVPSVGFRPIVPRAARQRRTFITYFVTPL